MKSIHVDTRRRLACHGLQGVMAIYADTMGGIRISVAATFVVALFVG
jgi:hypothetical protein